MTHRQRSQRKHEIRQAMRPPFVSRAERAKRLAAVRKTFTYEPVFWAQVWLRWRLHTVFPRLPRAWR